MTAEKQEFSFQAEIKQLLHLLAHSLYQSREIALRELISNASDALDKLRFVRLTDPAHRDGPELAIHLVPDKQAGTLTIADNGIGMSREELVQNLGTIAHSGSLSFLNHLTGDARKDLSLIGQFGVGFYSAFMLAERVTVRSRSYNQDAGWQWESDGAGRFSVAPAEGVEQGTSVILTLKEDAKEFLEAARIKEVVRRYSSFVPHPIFLMDERLNDTRPIWVEPKSKLDDEQYLGFYRHLTHRSEETPLWRLHISADSPIQFHAVLYCPPSNWELLGLGRIEHGLYLCAKRILVQSDCRELLPEYLRFVIGLVDSEDLPLNVSRETLQDHTVFRKIRALLVKKVLDRLDELAAEKPEEYLAFYKQFGVILREGIHSDFEHRTRIAGLLRFRTTKSADPEARRSLADVVTDAPESQKKIYFAGGPSAAAIRNNPNLEIFLKREIEVLLLDDPVDEYLLSLLGEFEGKEIVSTDAADLELPEEEKKEAEKSEPPVGGLGRLIDVFKRTLEPDVADVRESKRLADSPCCLVQPEGGVSAQMQKLLEMTQKDYHARKRIFEINPRHPLIERLAALTANPDHDEFLRQCAEQLYESALLLEGQVRRPERTVARMQRFMEEAAAKRSPLIL